MSRDIISITFPSIRERGEVQMPSLISSGIRRGIIWIEYYTHNRFYMHQVSLAYMAMICQANLEFGDCSSKLSTVSVGSSQQMSPCFSVFFACCVLIFYDRDQKLCLFLFIYLFQIFVIWLIFTILLVMISKKII